MLSTLDHTSRFSRRTTASGRRKCGRSRRKRRTRMWTLTGRRLWRRDCNRAPPL
ncbi:hypothetical protein DPMN_133382 [Dreissena polymorpha]|uniref:Uncharacterized protein n=1 Tax=Dreissena polymorpha TaxID=45954 RepID=A0A9D4JAX6_DREPO|nr:hypothetical protein DPMN_133382 [Dreissena polymorpha]